MSKETRGKIVSYTDKEGKLQKAIARDSEQIESLTRQGRVYLRLINEDYTPKKVDGKNVIAVKQASTLKLIGFVD